MADLTNRDIRLIHALSDFQQAMSALTFIDELEPDREITRVELRRYRCLEDAAVVAYWRPFSQSQGLPSLSLKQIGLIPSDRELRLHELIKLQRNKVVAHTDVDRMRIALKAWRPHPGFSGVLPHIIRDDSLALFNQREEWMDWLRKVVDATATAVFARMQDVGEVDFKRDYLLD